tara:strand:- start:125 stop:355 length:231 start_codon:yes stop_codon:yes gene_type:complete
MDNVTKFVKYKLCKTCNKEAYFENFRKVISSLDRIIPKKSYIQGNLVIVSDIINCVKSDSSLDDMEKNTNILRKEN